MFRAIHDVTDRGLRRYGFAPAPGIEVDADRRAFRDALGRYPTGVAVAMTRDSTGKPAGITINSFASVSLEPPLVLWSIERTAATAPAFLAATDFSVNVLGAAQEPLARRFALASGTGGEAPGASDSGVPTLGEALACFVCRRESVFDGGDHAILVGRVLDFSMREGSPLVFHEGRFLSL